jgi:dienelactone hydrolase
MDGEEPAMTTMVLFHHVQGLTDGVRSFADDLRAAGHTVHTPDLFDGQTFATLDEGMAHAREVGFGAILERGVAAGRDLPDDVVYAGFSMGVMPAQKLAQDAGAQGCRGAVFMDACLPPGEFGDTWPAALPVQVHGMDADPFFAEEGGDVDAAREVVSQADDGALFLYDGSVHLFADDSLDVHHPDATALLTERVLAFLDRVGDRADEEGGGDRGR